MKTLLVLENGEKTVAGFYPNSDGKSAVVRWFGTSADQERPAGRRCEYVHVRLTKTSMFSTLPAGRS